MLIKMCAASSLLLYVLIILGGYTCSDGKKLEYNTGNVDVTSGQKFVIGTLNSLWMMEYKDLERLNVTKLDGVVGNITAVAYNIKNNIMFIVDEITKSVMKLNLHNYKVDIIITNVEHITALDYDYFGNNLYWSDSEREIVELYSLETKAKKIISTLSWREKIISIALVPEFGYIFLSAQMSQKHFYVGFFYMDGSNIITFLRVLLGPAYLTYDPFLKNIFWIDYSTGNIESFHLIDKQRKFFKSSESFVTRILVSQNNVFWIKQKSNKVFWSDKSYNLGSHRSNHFIIDEINPNEDITHFISISSRSSQTHLCEYHNGNCSHICVPGINMSAKCLCPFDMNLTSDGKTCNHVLICDKDEFKCNKSEICIPMSSRCDRKRDCIYGEDESDCPTVDACPKEYFQCHNKDCIDKSLVCNMIYDCRDGSDELHCHNMTITSKCKRNEFMCSGGKCILDTSICNNVTDFSGGEDELNCTDIVKCKKDSYRRPIGDCIPNEWLCDQELDCMDGSDEHKDCDYKKCKIPDFICNTGLCIDKDLVCNNVNDCGDNSDEVQCKKNYTNNCKPNEFSCYQSNSICLPSAVRCNKKVECPNYEDEEDCSECPLGEFMCSDGKCIPSVYVCDRYTDCDDKSDESYTLCSHITPSEAPPNESISCGNKFTCKDVDHCIDNHLVCNGAYNCKDGSDEGGLCSVSCNQTCTSCIKTPQGPKCLCQKGFRLSGDHITCVDIEECKEEPPVCSQMCEELQGSFNCKCYTDFELRHDRISCKSMDKNLAYTIMSNDTIFTISPNQKLEEVFVANSVFKITDFDISVPNNLIYFITEDDGELHRINLTTKEHSYMSGLGRPRLLSVEWISENVYYVNENITNRLIHVCNFETRYCSVIHSVLDNKTKITALTVDAVNKYIFFSLVETSSLRKSKIYKSNLYGSYVEEIYVSYNNDYVTGLIFDFHKKLLYFANQNNGLVFKITYHGTDKMAILHNFPNSSNLNTYENHLYFLNSRHELEICPLFGNSHACTNNILHDTEIAKFVMNHSSIQQLSNKSGCQTSKCSKLCVPIEDTVTCLCESTKSNSNQQGCIEYQWSKYSGKRKEENSSSGISVWIWLLSCLVVVVAVSVAVYFVLRISKRKLSKTFAFYFVTPRDC